MKDSKDNSSSGLIEEKTINPTNILLAFLIGTGALLFVIGSIASFDLNKEDSIKLSVITIFVYTIILYILLNPKTKKRKIEKQRIEVPIIKEKPVIKEVYVEKPELPKFKYIGSTETKTYHKSSCRFSKLIKEKYKINKNEIKYFKENKFKPCKICKP